MKTFIKLLFIALMMLAAPGAYADTPIEIDPKDLAATEKVIDEIQTQKQAIISASASTDMGLDKALQDFAAATSEEDKEKYASRAESAFTRSVQQQLDPLEKYDDGLGRLDHVVGRMLTNGKTPDARDMASGHTLTTYRDFVSGMGELGDAMRRNPSAEISQRGVAIQAATGQLRELILIAQENRQHVSREMLEEMRETVLTARSEVRGYIRILKEEMEGIVQTRTVSKINRIQSAVRRLGLSVLGLAEDYRKRMRPIREYRTGRTQASADSPDFDPYAIANPGI